MKNTLLGLCSFSVLLAGCANTVDRRINLAEIDKALASISPVTVPSDGAVIDALLPAPTLPISKTLADSLSPRFDLVVNNAPVQQVLMGMVADTPYNMLVHPDIKGTVTLQLKNVSVPEVMQSLSDLYGYDYRIDGNRITVLAPGLRTKVFSINYPTSLRNGESEVRVISGSLTDTSAGSSNSGGTGLSGANTVVNSTRVRTSNRNDFWQNLATSLGVLVPAGEGRSVLINAEANLVMIRAMPKEIRAVEEYLKVAQNTLVRQITLEAKILEVQLSDGFQSGINWNVLGSHHGKPVVVGAGVNGNSLSYPTPGIVPKTTTDTMANVLGVGVSAATGRTASGLFALALQTSDFGMMLQLLGSQGSVEVLSSPRIATLNNQQAVLKVGTDEFFITGITNNNTTTGNSVTSSPSFTTQPFFSGVALDVTPQIDGDGNVILHIHPSVSEVNTVTKQIDLGSGGTYSLPLASSTIKETDSIVRAKMGQVIAIGGLMSRTSSRNRNEVPGLGRLPVMGRLFSNDNQSSVKRELVILLKATIADEDSEALRERLSQIETAPK
ncbi:pilus (MSHA type) biogenesis protein MshL [Chitinimonas sp. PSY-7]|uniref:pilus (MSHA type) biogenesis protein MshL n=1 Tax=Chitinimonas sp. PSY-7 TaxID=3459088 RepID=UPI00403FCC11